MTLFTRPEVVIVSGKVCAMKATTRNWHLQKQVFKCFATSSLATLIVTHGYHSGSVFTVVLPSCHVHDCVTLGLMASHGLGRSLGSIVSQFEHLEAVFDTCFGGPTTSADDQMTRAERNWMLVDFTVYSFLASKVFAWSHRPCQTNK